MKKRVRRPPPEDPWRNGSSFPFMGDPPTPYPKVDDFGIAIRDPASTVLTLSENLTLTPASPAAVRHVSCQGDRDELRGYELVLRSGNLPATTPPPVGRYRWIASSARSNVTAVSSAASSSVGVRVRR